MRVGIALCGRKVTLGPLLEITFDCVISDIVVLAAICQHVCEVNVPACNHTAGEKQRNALEEWDLSSWPELVCSSTVYGGDKVCAPKRCGWNKKDCWPPVGELELMVSNLSQHVNFCSSVLSSGDLGDWDKGHQAYAFQYYSWQWEM